MANRRRLAADKGRRPAADKGRLLSEYALENKRRQSEWELGFRERIEWLIGKLGGPGKVQVATHIKGQSLQKMRKGGSRLAMFATLVEMTGVNPTWLLLGTHSEPRFRSSVVSSMADETIDEVAMPVRRSRATAPSKKRSTPAQ